MCLDKIHRYAKIILVIPACFFGIQALYGNFKNVQSNFKHFYAKNIDEKYFCIDGDFYQFMIFCKDRIPAGSSLLFNNLESDNEKASRVNFFELAYLMEKSRFYLYPIKVYIDQIDYTEGGKKVSIFQNQNILNSVRFVASYKSSKIFPGFKIAYKYGDNSYILVRQRQ